MFNILIRLGIRSFKACCIHSYSEHFRKSFYCTALRLKPMLRVNGYYLVGAGLPGDKNTSNGSVKTGQPHKGIMEPSLSFTRPLPYRGEIFE